MSRVLHLFNILGAPTEANWLAYASKLAQFGHDVVCGYETLGDAGRESMLPKRPTMRVHIQPSDDVCGQMKELGARLKRGEFASLIEEDFEIVHGHGGTRVLQASPWLIRRVPTVISLYGYDCSRLLRDRCWGERYRWSSDHGAVFAVLHRSMRLNLEDVGIPRTSIREVPLGIQLEDWPYVPPEDSASRPPRFIFVGRLVEKKSPVVLIRALAALRDEFGVHAHLDMVGDGPLRADVEAAIRALDLHSAVVLHGELDRTSVRSMFGTATGLVLPSARASDGDSEGTPIVLMEAQAVGVPCITTNHAGNADVLAREMRVLLVERADANLLAAKMAELTQLSPVESRSLCDAGRAWIESKFNLDRTAAAYDELYREMLTP